MKMNEYRLLKEQINIIVFDNYERDKLLRLLDDIYDGVA